MKDLRYCRKICNINLSHNSLTDEGLSHLLFFFTQCSYLSTINLSYNSITIRSLRVLATLLEECESIKKIDISGMPMEAEFANQFKRLGEIADCEIVVSTDLSGVHELEQCKSITFSLNTCLVLLFKQYILTNPYELFILLSVVRAI